MLMGWKMDVDGVEDGCCLKVKTVILISVGKKKSE